MDDADELFGGALTGVFGHGPFREEIFAHMLLEKLRHQSVDCAARRCHALDDFGTARIGGKRTLDGVDLPAQPAHAIDQFVLFAQRMVVRLRLARLFGARRFRRDRPLHGALPDVELNPTPLVSVATLRIAFGALTGYRAGY